MPTLAPTARLNQFFRIARLLAGQLDFRSAIRAVGAEVAAIIPHDHLDVCIVGANGRFHTAYESGIDTGWGQMAQAPVDNSPIRALLMGEVDHILTPDACADFAHGRGSVAFAPIFDHDLHGRIHVPMIVHGEIIGALSCSSHRLGCYGPDDVRNARYVAELLSPYFFALRATEQARQSAIVEAEARAREEGLRQGALRLTEALEGERQRIGMDLHDQTLADLTRLARRMDRLSALESVDGAALVALSRSLQQSMQALRQIIEAAKPSVLQLFGFADAVENHLDRAIRESGQTLRGVVQDHTEGAIDALPPSVGVALFRIGQEAINNAVHHAQAGQVTVNLGISGGKIVITVSDDGQGIARPKPKTGSGIENMKTRARLISARFAIVQGDAGRGTKVSISLATPALVRA